MNAMEVVHDGWLTKSPPEKRIWKAKWRRRWFILRHSGQLPGQFILEYYTDPTKRKLKGKIDLDQCEQVDSGLTFEARKSNQTYRFIFDIRTPKRTYYLVAETEPEMIRWVNSICSVCGLKIHMEEDFDTSAQPPIEPNINNNITFPSPADVGATNLNNNEPESSSGQYIFISDCLSGPPISRNRNVNQLSFDLVRESISSLPDEPPPPLPRSSPDRLVSGEFYDVPRSLQLVGDDSSLDSDLSSHMPSMRNSTTPTTPVSPLRDSQSSLWSKMPPRVNWNTYPAESVLSSLDMHQILETPEKQTDGIVDISSSLENFSFSANESTDTPTELIPPPRPPKPSNLGENRKYENMSPVLGIPKNRLSADSKVPPPPASGVLSPDELYDFPRPLHEGVVDIAQSPPAANMASLRRPRRHAYSNAPAGFIEDENNVFRYDVNSVSSQQPYLSMDVGTQNPGSSGSDVYTDMSASVADGHSTPSSLTPTTAGAVYCNVSPGLDGSMTIIDLPPAVNRNLKPRKKVIDCEGDSDLLTLAPPPACRIKADPQQSFHKPFRNMPSPTIASTQSVGHAMSLRRRNSDQSSDDELSSMCDSPLNTTFDSDRKFPMRKCDSEIQYLDLDLDAEGGASSQVGEVKSPKTPDKSSSTTVYKIVDFVKTKAFNETRQNVESYRKNSQS